MGWTALGALDPPTLSTHRLCYDGDVPGEMSQKGDATPRVFRGPYSLKQTGGRYSFAARFRVS